MPEPLGVLESGTATFMIAGDRCTRACGFCAVKTAKPFALEADEPDRVATAVTRLKLSHVVITAVARDDLPDGGAQHLRKRLKPSGRRIRKSSSRFSFPTSMQRRTPWPESSLPAPTFLITTSKRSND